MVIECETQIVKRIGLKITEDDVDGFLEDLDQLFDDPLFKKYEKKNGETSVTEPSEIFPTLYKIWLEVKQET